MSIIELERAITRLSTSELTEFARWFDEYKAQAWDNQIEKDLESGRLDKLLREVEKEYEGGLSKPL